MSSETNKLLVAAIRLLHKKENDEFQALFDALDGKYTPSTKRYNFNKVWFWGLQRWKGDWINMDYSLRYKQDDTNG